MRRGVPPSCPAGTEDLPSPPSEELRLKCEEAERLRGLLSGGHQGATWAPRRATDAPGARAGFGPAPPFHMSEPQGACGV